MYQTGALIPLISRWPSSTAPGSTAPTPLGKARAAPTDMDPLLQLPSRRPFVSVEEDDDDDDGQHPAPQNNIK
eukprot:3193823-Rhodomonas_salina.2